MVLDFAFKLRLLSALQMREDHLVECATIKRLYHTIASSTCSCYRICSEHGGNWWRIFNCEAADFSFYVLVSVES